MSNDLKIFTELNGKLVDVFPKYATVKTTDSEMAHFIECVKTGKEPISSAKDGVRIQKVLDAIYLSSKLKRI